MLTPYDYAVIVFYFAFMAGMGWLFKRFIRNTSDYFRGGGEMLWWIAGASAFMVQFSAWTFTGAASKAYVDGPLIIALFFANAVGYFFNFIYFAPAFRQMRAVTAIQCVRERFGAFSEQFYTWVQLPVGITGASIWLYGLAVFSSAVFGFDLAWTIVITGVVVVVMSVIGGSWAVVAGDFIQVLIVLPVTVVAAVLAVAYVGGPTAFVQQLPANFTTLQDWATPQVAYLWIVAMLIKQFISINNLMDASRYLNVKDGRHARRAALFATLMMLIGPIVWFVPPMAAAIVHPDLAARYPALQNPSEAAYVAMCSLVFPAGLMGVLVSAIFAATMSSMDSGLNKNAGFFIKNFYQVAIRPRAGERELVIAGKVTTLALGVLVILAARYFSSLKDLPLFDLMLKFSTLVGTPIAIPLVWGMLVKRAPQWAGWTTVLVTLTASLVCGTWLDERLAQYFFGGVSRKEMGDWTVVVGLFVNVAVGSTWYLGTTLLAGTRSPAEVRRVDAFFQKMHTPVDFEREEGHGSDVQQLRTLGFLCSVYGGFISLLTLIPNGLVGRLCFLFCGASMGGIGLLLWRAARRASAAEIADSAVRAPATVGETV